LEATDLARNEMLLKVVGNDLKFVQFDETDFVRAPLYSEETGLPKVEATTWWHASTELSGKAPQSVDGVTHLGNRASAEKRASDQAHFNFSSRGIYEIKIPPLSIFPVVYIENWGPPGMRGFESLLLASNHDVAFTWNQKEASGAWAIIIRRSVIGEIPSRLNRGFRIIRRIP
jgi:hypothetical protein